MKGAQEQIPADAAETHRGPEANPAHTIHSAIQHRHQVTMYFSLEILSKNE